MKKDKEVILDENGNPIKDKKKIDWKKIGLTTLKLAACFGCGFVAFVGVGVAMAIGSEVASQKSATDGVSENVSGMPEDTDSGAATESQT